MKASHFAEPYSYLASIAKVKYPFTRTQPILTTHQDLYYTLKRI